MQLEFLEASPAGDSPSELDLVEPFRLTLPPRWAVKLVRKVIIET